MASLGNGVQSAGKVKVWETEKEITFGSNGSVSADIIAVGEITL